MLPQPQPVSGLRFRHPCLARGLGVVAIRVENAARRGPYRVRRHARAILNPFDIAAIDRNDAKMKRVIAKPLERNVPPVRRKGGVNAFRDEYLTLLRGAASQDAADGNQQNAHVRNMLA